MRFLRAIGRSARSPGLEILTFVPLALTSLALSVVLLVWLNIGVTPAEILRPQVAPITVAVDGSLDRGIVTALRLRVQELPTVGRTELVEDLESTVLAVHLRPGTDPEVAHALAGRLAEWGTVEEAFGEGWDSPRQLRRMALAVAIFSLLSGLGVIWSVIRHRVVARRHELRVMHLLGATRSDLARPHMVIGFLHTGAAIAVAYWVCTACFSLAKGPTSEFMARLGGALPIELAPVEYWLIAVGMVGCFAAWASRGAVKQVLRS